MRCIFFLSIYLTTILFAQDSSDFKKRDRIFLPDHSLWSISAGQSMFPAFIKKNLFQNTFEHLGFNDKRNFISVQIKGHLLMTRSCSEREGEFDGIFGLSVFMPEILKTDTTKFSLNGAEFNFFYGKDLLFFVKWLDLSPHVGFNWGMDVLRAENKLRRNPYFVPATNLEFRMFIWKIALTAVAEVGYDITSSKWKRKETSFNDVYGFKHHYTSFSFGVGWIVN